MRIEGLRDDTFKSEEYYVAYFDILGTKSRLKEDREGVFSKLWLINNFIKKERHKNKNLIIRAFSDNYLFAVKVDPNDPMESLNSLYNSAGALAVECLTVYGLLVRGAIVRGELYIDDEVVLGESLIHAYELESKAAVYPRILIDESAISIPDTIDWPIRSFDSPLFKDFDSAFCVNTLFFFNKKIRSALERSIVANVLDAARSAFKNKNASSIEKVEWTKNYVNDFYLQNHGAKIIKNFEGILKGERE